MRSVVNRLNDNKFQSNSARSINTAISHFPKNTVESIEEETELYEKEDSPIAQVKREILTSEQTKYENLQVTDDTPKSNFNSKDNSLIAYTAKLEKKVREQAIRLSALESYRFLCEKKIKQLKPHQTFPINESHLNNEVVNSEEESSSPQQVDSGGSDMKESYSLLLENYKELLYEKEEILEMLRRETLLNEENRNFIEVLKTSLQSEAVRSGLILDYITVDHLLDFDKLKAESDSYRKEVTFAHTILSTLKAENEELRQNNHTLINSKEKVKLALEQGLRELESCQGKMQELERERNNLEETNKQLRDEVEVLSKERDDLFNRNNTLTNKVKEINKMSEDQNEMVISRINEYRTNLDKVNSEFESLLKEKTKFEIENAKLNEQLERVKDKFEKSELINKHLHPTNQSNFISNSLLYSNESVASTEYKKLFEEVSVEYEEFKKSHKKILNSLIEKLKKSYIETQEKLLEENNFLTNENHNLNLDLQKHIISLQTAKNDYEELFKNYNKSVQMYENEFTMTKTLSNENTNLLAEINKLKEDKQFLKDKSEKDNTAKGKEIKLLQEEIDSLKTQLNKQKENLREMQKAINEGEEAFDESTNKLEKYEKLISNLNEKESQLLEKSEQLLQTSKKYNNLLNEVETSHKEAEKNNKIITLLKIEKGNLEEKLLEEIKKNEDLEYNLNSKEKEVDSLSREVLTTVRDFDKTNDKLSKLIEEKDKLESEVREKDNKISNLQNDFSKSENKIDQLMNDREGLSLENYQLIEKLKAIQDFKSEIKINCYSLHSLLKVTINKFNSYANEDLDSLLTKTFSQNLTRLVHQVSSFTSEVEEKEIIILSSELIKVLSKEFENCYEKLIESNHYIKEAHGKIILLENSLNEVSESQGQWIEKEKKLKNAIKAIGEEKSNYEMNLREQNEETLKELDYMKREREESFNELIKLKNEMYNALSKNEELKEENAQLCRELEDSHQCLIRAENRSMAIHKEKKYTDGLLLSFVRSFPSKDMSKLMNEVITINDFIFKTENEKMKIEEKLLTMEKESKFLLEDKSSLNNDLSVIVKNEQDNLTRLIKDYEKKITEKKELQKVIEQEIFNLESDVKSVYERNANVVDEYRRLEKEFEEFKKGLNLNQNRQVVKYQTMPNAKPKSEISCLDSNIFSVDLNRNFSPEKEQNCVLTNYESIEFEYSDGEELNQIQPVKIDRQGKNRNTNTPKTTYQNPISKMTKTTSSNLKLGESIYLTKEPLKQKNNLRRENIDKINTINPNKRNISLV